MEEQYKIVRAWFKYVVRVVKRKTAGALMLRSLAKDVSRHYQVILEDTQELIKDNGRELCEAVVDEVEKELDIKIENKKKIVESAVMLVITGALYKSRWTLEKAAEQISERLADVIDGIVEHGKDKDPKEVAEEILKVVDPDNHYQKSYDVNDNTVYITRIDGETQRLVRTTVEHIFQEAFVEVAEQIAEQTKYVVKIRWVSMLSENTCEVCESRHNELYDPADLPLEHPNGQCDFWIELYPA